MAVRHARNPTAVHTRRLLGLAAVGITVAASVLVSTAIAAAPEQACRDVSRLGAVPLAIPDGASRSFDDLLDVRATMAMSALPPGGNGAGVTVADIEFDWDPFHEDLKDRRLPTPGRFRENAAQDISHGTAVLSLIGGDADGSGITGLAPGAALAPLSPYVGGQYVPDEAITNAAAGLRAGDVLLIELQSGLFGPVETDGFHGPKVRAAIAAAVAKGIVVVEPVGNLGEDLATFGVTADSPALIVGAGSAAAAGHLERGTLVGSNTGTRIDVQGPGEAVVTATSAPSYFDFLQGGSGNGSRSYTHCFGGSSSAAASVAGAVAAMQGIARARRGAPFSPAEVRERLVITGVPQTDPQNGNIGPLPQVRAAADLDEPPSPSALRTTASGPVAPGRVALRWNSSPTDIHGGAGRSVDQILVDDTVVGTVDAELGAFEITVPNGSHRVVVRSLDRVGNASSTSLDLVVDADAPAAPHDLTPGGGTSVPSGPLTLRWKSARDDPPPNGSGRAADVVVFDGQEVARVAAGVGALEVQVAPGAHSWQVRSFDVSGNSSQTTAAFTAAAQGSGAAAVPPPGARLGRRAGRLLAARRQGAVWLVPVRMRSAARARATANGKAVNLVNGRGVIRVARGAVVRVRLTSPRLPSVSYRLSIGTDGRLVVRLV